MIEPQSQPKTRTGFLDRVVFRNRTLLILDIIVIISHIPEIIYEK